MLSVSFTMNIKIIS